MFNNIKKFFTYNKRERSGTIILMIMIFMLIMLNMLMPYLQKTKQIDYSVFENEIKEFEMKKTSKKNNIFYTDADKQIEKYHEKKDNEAGISRKKPEVIQLKIDINKADSSELLKLKGIGPVFASRIIKYRNLLGGYNNAGQLLEVYGMDSSRYQQIVHNITVSLTDLKRISINNSTFSELLRHPYIPYKIVQELVNYRKANGGFSDLSELLNIPGIDSVKYSKILPYISI